MNYQKLRKLLLLLFTGLLFTTQGISQVTTEGTEFWLGFMSNFDSGAPSSLELFITSKTEANVEIFVYTDGSTRNVTVTPGITHQEFISISLDNPYAATLSGNIEQKAIRITSDVNISVYAFNNRQRSADATVVLPASSLGREYYVAAYWEDEETNQDSPSEFLIVASQDDTEIEITTSAPTISGQPANQPFTITLNQGEIYQVQADADLTGSFIRASEASGDCKNFAVFGGNQWGRITFGQDCSTAADPVAYAPDHLFEQMYPTNTWGRNYVSFPMELRNNYGLRIMAGEDDTEITIGSDVITLNSGEYEDFVLNELVAINANKPIQVAQFSFSLSCDNNSRAGSGDPFMMMLNPNEQQLQEINFNALNATELDNYFLTIITDSDNTDNVFLNGAQLNSGEFQTVPGAVQYAYGNFTIQKALDYNLFSDGGFVAYIYAFGFIESFGYVAGASLENLNLQAQGEDEFIDIIADQACLNAEIDFTALFETPAGQEPRFNTFEWDFGDGTVAEGESILKVYDEPGFYDIVLIASDGQGSCGTSETVIRTIEVVPTEVSDIMGSSSVCPDVFGIEYSVTGGAGNSYEWTVVGGTIAQDNGSSILVDWGSPNPNASVTLSVKNSIGCEIDDLVLDVVINKLLEPIAAFSDSFIAPGTLLSEVCFENRNRDRYYVNPTNGSNYTWRVEGGTFTADTNPNGTEVFVDWGNSTSGRIWYTESNELIDDCDGDSDILDVVIYQPIRSVATIDNVLCNGEANGEISLAISGGRPGDYEVTWDNGMTGASITGLPVGDYKATITDEIGCELVETYTVTEPEVLTVVGAAQTLPVRCFQESNGVADITVIGGTKFPNGNYQFLWESPDFQTTTTNNVNTSLPAGDYNVTITDANGCQTSTSVTITQPPLLEADLETLINETICPQADDGTAFIDAKGGTPDYQFFWSNKPNVEDQNASDLSAGNYTVRIIDSNGCETSYEIQVEERLPKIYIPNAFSPNGDTQNDTFKPVGDCSGQYYMQLYNQWGSIVFSTEDLSEGWDGNYRGALAPIGEYSYVIFYANTVNGVSFEDTYRGSFKLIR